jgi:hypothetical protein
MPGIRAQCVFLAPTVFKLNDEEALMYLAAAMRRAFFTAWQNPFL